MNQKVALVTGGNKGLGLETCRQLGAQGFQILLTSRDPAKGNLELKNCENKVLMQLTIH